MRCRAANGASLGLQVPYLRGDEDVQLLNLCAGVETLRFKLPGEVPRIWTDGRDGKMNETKPVLHTVIIEPDELRVSLVWRGNAPARRIYLKDELDAMPARAERPRNRGRPTATAGRPWRSSHPRAWRSCMRPAPSRTTPCARQADS